MNRSAQGRRGEFRLLLFRFLVCSVAALASSYLLTILIYEGLQWQFAVLMDVPWHLDFVHVIPDPTRGKWWAQHFVIVLGVPWLVVLCLAIGSARLGRYFSATSSPWLLPALWLTIVCFAHAMSGTILAIGSEKRELDWAMDALTWTLFGKSFGNVIPIALLAVGLAVSFFVSRRTRMAMVLMSPSYTFLQTTMTWYILTVGVGAWLLATPLLFLTIPGIFGTLQSAVGWLIVGVFAVGIALSRVDDGNIRNLHKRRRICSPALIILALVALLAGRMLGGAGP